MTPPQLPAPPIASPRPNSAGGRRRRRSLRARAALLAALAALAGAGAVAGACDEVGTDPDEAISIAFDSLPAPAVVVGDTLRDDSTGVVRGLFADAYNGKGDRIAGAKFTFFPRDTGGAIEIVNDTLLIARKPRSTSAGIVASLGGLQLTDTIAVVPRPDSLLRGVGTLKTVRLVTLDTTDRSADSLRVLVMHDTVNAAGSAVATVPVRSWVVFYHVDYAAPSMADSVRLVNAAWRRATRDTTDATGAAMLRLRVYPKSPLPTSATNDSVVVSAFARHRGAQLGGSPVRLVVQVTR